ncbi:MAG: translation initiation factor IF-2 [Patescibacteria group bacterium]
MAQKTATTPLISTRPPVIVIMGHIDHGKSTLLDYIRKSNTTAKEAGGITQHLGAYEVAHTNPQGKKGTLTFLDTPGHEAFSGIRARGAKVADIAILVVSAEDGVKPQTLEALECIKEAKLPYIVAINKIDKPNANPEKTKQNLAENEIYIEGYGGDVPWVPVSALTGQGIPELLDMVMLVAEIADLKADLAAPAHGVVIEAHRDNRKGVTATLLVKEGILKSGGYVVADNAFSPVRIFEDFQGKPIKEAKAGSPCRVIGWSLIPAVGAQFFAYESKRDAEETANSFKPVVQKDLGSRPNNGQNEKILLPLIIKADATGSLEGIRHEFAKIQHDKVAFKIVSEAIGNISEADLKAAQGLPSTIILGFNIDIDPKAASMLERNPMNVKTYKIIYELTEYAKTELMKLVPKEKIVETLGSAKVQAIFSKNKDKQIVGGKVQKDSIMVGAEVKIIRRDAEIGLGRIRELQQQKEKAQEVREGYEFGAMLESKIEIAPGDKIEAFRIVER